MATLDATVVGIALPAVSRSFHSGLESLQWVVTGYGVTLAAFLLTGGSLGDRFGRRRLFCVGIVWFAVASAGCGFAPDAGVLIAARILQGIGAALLTPSSLAILQASFRPGDRSRAIGAWSGLSGVAAAAGPLLGGYLIAVGSWRWVFFINLPIAATVLMVAFRHVPESFDPTSSGPVDVLGAALGVICLSGLTYGIIDASARGWARPGVVLALVASATAALALVFVERISANPMLPLALFRRRQFTAANAVTFVVYGALGGILFLLPVELQLVARKSALVAGLALLPITIVMLLLSERSGRLAARIGPRLQMSSGPLLVGVGLALLSRAGASSTYLTVVIPAVTVLGFGLAITVAPLTATALGAAPPEHAGVASAFNNVVARASGLIAVAVLPLVAGIAGAKALSPAHFASGFRLAVAIAGATCAAGGILAALTITNERSAATFESDARDDWHCALDATPLRGGTRHH